MPEVKKARVFMSGRSQHVTIPAEFRFKAKEVNIRRDEGSGDVILSHVPEMDALDTHAYDSWTKLLAALEEAPFPENFLADRAQGVADVREEW